MADKDSSKHNPGDSAEPGDNRPADNQAGVGKKPVKDWIKDKFKGKKDKIKEEDPNIYPMF